MIILNFFSWVANAFFDFLYGLKSKKAAYSMGVLLSIAIDSVLAWRCFSIYWDVMWLYTNAVLVTCATSIVAFFAVFLSSSVISLHPPKDWRVFLALCALAVTHDWGGIFFTVYQNTLLARSFPEFWGMIWVHPGNTILVAALSCLGLIPLVLAPSLQDWHTGMQEERVTTHANFMTNATNNIERYAILKIDKLLKKKDLPELLAIISNDKLRDLGSIVTRTKIVEAGPQLPQISKQSQALSGQEDVDASDIHLIEEKDFSAESITEELESLSEDDEELPDDGEEFIDEEDFEDEEGEEDTHDPYPLASGGKTNPRLSQRFAR